MSNTFGKTLAELMKQKGVSGRVLANKLGVPHRTVQEWVGSHGNRMPRDPAILKNLSSYFSVSVHFLLYGEQDPRNPLNELLEKTELHTGLYEVTIRRVQPKNGKKA